MDTASTTPSGAESSFVPTPPSDVSPAPTTVEPPANLPIAPNAMFLPAEYPKRNASYGALISIIIILAIVVVGAFYSWGKRIEQNNVPAVINEVPGITDSSSP